jgi:hypothetical protein
MVRSSWPSVCARLRDCRDDRVLQGFCRVVVRFSGKTRSCCQGSNLMKVIGEPGRNRFLRLSDISQAKNGAFAETDE